MPRKDPRLDDIADSFNERVQDRVIRHMLFLEGLKTRQSKEVLKFIDDDIIPDLISQLTARLSRIEARGFDTGPATTQRIEQMIRELSLTVDRFKDINTRIQGELFDLAIDEQVWQVGVLNEEADVNIGMQAASSEQIRQVVFNKPFDGRTIEQWFDRLAESAKARLSQEIRRGVVEGMTTAQVVRSIQNDGFLKTTRAQTDAVVRSAVQHASNASRQRLFEENDDLLKGVQWLATLDSRTCLQCSPLDGKIFPVNSGPRPPIHPSCRCAIVPVTKSSRSMGLGFRSSMNGQVPSDITYNQWLKKQPIDVQEMALGKTKAKLFRDGGLDVSQFVNRNRVELTLKDIRAKEAGAFEKAGIVIN